MQELASAYSDQTFPTATDANLSDSQETKESSGGKNQRSGHTFQNWFHSSFLLSENLSKQP